MSSLTRYAPRTFAMLAAVALLFSAAGPLIDHHFAEWQPGHLHLVSFQPEGHSHSINRHYHATSNGTSDQPVAIYRSDAASSAVPSVTATDFLLASQLSFEPSSLIFLPLDVRNGAGQVFEAPPAHPPQVSL
ncbi:MAG: hypothetical protein O2821_00090 [Chloroflexi bacterium]|nr:hypothetical protein [Chloroflexota bacterium]